MEAPSFYEGTTKRVPAKKRDASPHGKKRKAAVSSPGCAKTVRLVKKKAVATVLLKAGSAAIPSSYEEVSNLKEMLYAMEKKVEAMASQLESSKKNQEAMARRIEQLEARLVPQYSSTPAPPSCHRRTFSSPRTSRGRDLFQPTTDESLCLRLEATGPDTSMTTAPTPAQQCIEDVTLRALSAEREESFFQRCVVLGEHQPDIYASNVFMALTPFEAYTEWVRKVNWTGTNGKRALPENLKNKVHDYVNDRFPDLTADQWYKIRNKINERLRSSRKLDPEMYRAGFI